MGQRSRTQRPLRDVIHVACSQGRYVWQRSPLVGVATSEEDCADKEEQTNEIGEDNPSRSRGRALAELPAHGSEPRHHAGAILCHSGMARYPAPSKDMRRGPRGGRFRERAKRGVLAAL